MRHERKFRVVERYDERYPGWVRLIALFLVFLAGFLLWRGAIEVIFGLVPGFGRWRSDQLFGRLSFGS